MLSFVHFELQTVFAPAEINWATLKNVQYTQKSHLLCTIWVDIGCLWTPKHPLEHTVALKSASEVSPSGHQTHNVIDSIGQ